MSSTLSHHRLPGPAALAPALLAALLAAPAGAGDWPQFRGPGRDGISAETGLRRSWPEEGPAVCWRRPLGEGFSGVTVGGDRLFTLFADTQHELALGLDPATGEEIWRTPIGPRFDEPLGNGPRSTATLDGDLLYVLSSTGGLHALDPASGETRWRVDAQQDLGAPMPLRGFTCSPLVEGDLLVVELGAGEGKGLVAFDKRTGEVRWSARDTPAGHASPLAVTIGGVRQLVHLPSAGKELAALLPDGRVYWTHPWPPGAIAMPVFVPPDRIFVSASADIGAMVVEVAGTGGAPEVHEVWRNRRMKNHFSSSVLHEGVVYGFDNGTFKAIAADTGEQLWAHRGLGKGSLIVADDLLIVLSDRGELVLAEASPEGFEPSGQIQVLSGKTWTAPALAGGRLYLRNHEEIVCLDLTAPASAAAGVSPPVEGAEPGDETGGEASHG